MDLLKLFEKVTKCLEGTNRIIEVVGNICIWGMFTIVFVNTLLRMLIGFSFTWAEEISKLLMVWMALLVAVVALYENRHVALTFLFEKLSAKAQPVALLIFDGLTFVFSCILTESGFWYVFDNMTAVLPASGLPRYVLYLPFPICGALMVVYSAYLMWMRVLQIRGMVYYEAKTGEEEIG